MSFKVLTNDTQRMMTMYQERWTKYGHSAQALGWTKGKQPIRFDVLLSNLALENKSFLDVGCGFGDLNIALQKRCTAYQYYGIDIMPDFVKEATAYYGNKNVHFEIGNFISKEFSDTFDYVIASGIFNFKLNDGDNYEYIRSTLVKMFSLSKEAVSVDFLSDRVNFQHKHSFHSNPEKILSIAFEISKNVQLRHDYMPFEFSLKLFKDDSYAEQDTVFNRYWREKRDN
jgi:SAM-dependent methyltransferase